MIKTKSTISLILGLLVLIAVIFGVLYLKNINKTKNLNNYTDNTKQKCKDAKRIEFQEPINEITSAKIGSLGGTLQKKYDGDRWIIVKIPAGAVKNETNFSLIFKESNYIIRSGEKSPLTFEISPDISFDLPVEIIVQYGKTYGCNIVPVPYLVDENNELQPAQATELYSEQRIFTMDTFHGGSYSWIYATE